MKIAIRADASPAVGSGHLVRCLCLADVLVAMGATVQIVSRELPDHLRKLVVAQGHQVVDLPPWSTAADVSLDDCQPGQPWTNALQTRDAEETIASARGFCDWLVVDHYGLGATWESILRKNVTKLLAIDDLARAHDCNVLLDQNIYRDAELRYVGRVPADCNVLLGPRYALLRPDFHRLRSSIEARDGEVRRMLVFLGGMDADNVTETVLRAIRIVDCTDIHVDVVIGQLHPARETIESICTASSHMQCHVQTQDMAGLLAKADLAVGAGGTNTWERCALGVPTLALCLAENQRQVLRDGSRAGILYTPDDGHDSDAALANHLQALLANSGLRNHLSQAGLDLVDGQGAQRVAALLTGREVSIRRATAEDSVSVHAWRNDPSVRAVSRESRELSYADHQRWYAAALASPNRHILIGERRGSPLGVVRFDTESTSAEVSIYLVPGRTGQGDGTALLLAGEQWLKVTHPEIETVHAEVLASNVPSHRLFKRCSYHADSSRYSKRLGT